MLSKNSFVSQKENGSVHPTARDQQESQMNKYTTNEYSCSVVWLRLNDMARRDAVREADGEAIMRHWNIDMPQYWTYNHNKYLIIGHRILAGKYKHIP